MKQIKPIAFEDAHKLTPGEMNALHMETGLHSDIVPASVHKLDRP